jgi:hypothetical protein
MGNTAILLDVAAVGTILLFGYIGALGKIPRFSGLSGFLLGVFLGIFLIALIPLLSTKFYTNLHGNSEKSVVVDSLSGILSYVIFKTTNM